MKKNVEFIDWVYPKDIDFGDLINEAELDSLHERIIIDELIKNNYVVAGDTHQNCMWALFNDGYIEVSMRRWGSIMATAMNIKLASNEYNYMNFYMACTSSIPECLPKNIQKRVDEDF